MHRFCLRNAFSSVLKFMIAHLLLASCLGAPATPDIVYWTILKGFIETRSIFYRNGEHHKTGQMSACLQQTSSTASAVLLLPGERWWKSLLLLRSQQRLEHFISPRCSCLQPRLVYRLAEKNMLGVCPLGIMLLALRLLACPFVSKRPNGISVLCEQPLQEGLSAREENQEKTYFKVWKRLDFFLLVPL